MTDSRRHALSHMGSVSTLVAQSEGHQSSSSSSTKRFRETIETIPSPEVELAGRRPKPYEPPYAHAFFIFGTPIIFILLGVALEIATRISDKQGGFKVPTVNVFGTVSGQFLASIIPTSIIIPYAIMYRSHDWVLRWFQPYIVLQKGQASAEESILLDYIYQGPFFSLFRALKYKHRVLFLSSFTAFVTYAFQPLAGSIFQIRQVPQTSGGQTTSLESIALANLDDISQLNGFLAASGYVEAAALHGLGDPPFVFRNWTTAAFVFPKEGLNETISVNTTAISTIVNCANPAQKVEVDTLPSGNLTFTSVSVEKCKPQDNVTFNATLATQQYGVVNAICPDVQEDDVTLQSVMFWFFHYRDDGQPEAKTIFCRPAIIPFNVIATAHLEDGRLDSCAQSAEFDLPNNVTDPPHNGRAFNGLIFNQSADPFVDARAKAISSGVPGTIFRTANRSREELQTAFDLPNGMLDITSRVYTQHLTISAKSIYFQKSNITIDTEQTSIVPRLWIDPLPAHFLALCLCLIGLTGLVIHFLNFRQRRKLLLAAPPGSIASITALTARSGFGELILPYDDEATLEKKLDGIKFRLDERTGAIVADEAESVPWMGRDDAMESLLGKPKLNQHSISSQAAFQTAIGYPPWVYKTPYDD